MSDIDTKARRERPHTVLCVDDEKNVLNALKRLLRKENYRFLSASSCSEALEVLEREAVHLILSDQRMPEMSGTDFLARVRRDYPDILRIILTGYTEVDAIMESINNGQIYKFFLKPWNDHNLKIEIRRALEQYDLMKTNRRLDEQVIEQNAELKRANERLEQVVRQRTRTLEIQNKALEFSRAILEELPIPVLGIDPQGTVAMMNRRAGGLVGQGGKIELGQPIQELLPETVCGRIADAISDDVAVVLEDVQVGFETYRVELIPLTGRYEGRGAVLAFSPRDTDTRVTVRRQLNLMDIGLSTG